MSHHLISNNIVIFLLLGPWPDFKIVLLRWCAFKIFVFHRSFNPVRVGRNLGPMQRKWVKNMKRSDWWLNFCFRFYRCKICLTLFQTPFSEPSNFEYFPDLTIIVLSVLISAQREGFLYIGWGRVRHWKKYWVAVQVFPVYFWVFLNQVPQPTVRQGPSLGI